MIHVTKTYDHPLYNSKIFDFYFGDFKIGVADIETTGLSPDKNAAVLLGLLEVTEKGLLLSQYFAESLSEEKDILKLYFEELSSFDVLVTYNGQSFDLPFLHQRAKKHNLTDGLDHIYDLDLFTVLRNHSPLKTFLPNLKQKTVESFMGLWPDRTDEISGAESVHLYYDYLSSGNEILRKKILLHNSDDLLQLYRLLKTLEKSNIHKALFTMGFPVDAPAAYVNKISITGSDLKICGKQQCMGIDYRIFESSETPYSLTFSAAENNFWIRMPLIRHERMKKIHIVAPETLGLDISSFEKYESCHNGLLVLKNDDVISYPETNHFVKAFLRSVTNKIKNAK